MNDVAPGSKKPAWRRIAGFALLAIAAAYLVWLLHHQWQGTAQALTAHPPGVIAMAILLAAAMMALKAAYQVLLLQRFAVPGSSRVALALSYALGQIVRYLPGKILGLLYQAQHLNGIAPLPAVFVVNLAQFVHTGMLTCGFAVTVATAMHYGPFPAVVLLLLTFCALLVSHRLSTVERLLRLAARILPFLRPVLDTGEPAKRSTGFAFAASLLLLAEWIPFVGGWMLLTQHGIGPAILAATSYAAASMIAAFAVVAPSGIVLREALFVWLGTQLDLDAGQLLALGLIVRLIYMCADLLLAALLLGLNSLHAKHR